MCRRSKREVAYVGGKGKFIFFLDSDSGRGAWSNASRICRQCHATLMSLELEVTELTGNKPSDSYEFVGLHELAIILNPQPHSQNAIRRSEAASLVERFRHRLGDGLQSEQTDDAQ